MLKKEIRAKNYLNQEMLYTCHFNLNKTELIMIDTEHNNSLADRLASIIEINDVGEMLRTIDDLIKRSYGVLTKSGNIIKKPEYLDEFVGSPAYDVVFEELSTDASKMVEFVKNVVPEEYRKEIEKNQELTQELNNIGVTTSRNADEDTVYPMAVPVTQ